MLIYWLIWFFICVFNFFGDYKSYINKFFYSIFLIFLMFFIGLRYEVGGDWENYLAIYDLFDQIDFANSLIISDPAYSLLNYISQYLEIKDTILVNFLCALIICVFIALSSFKLKKYWLFLLLYYPYHILAVSLGYTRQAVAVSVVVYAFTFLFDAKNKKFIFFVLFAALFHKTSIVFLIFLPLTFLLNKKYLLYLYEFLSVIFILIVLYISSTLEDNIYTNADSEISSSGVFMRISMHFIPMIIYLLYRKSFFKQNLNYIYLDFFVVLIGMVTLLAIPFSTLADRFNLYLIFFDLLVITCSYGLLKKSNRVLLLFLLVIYFTAFIAIWIFYGEWAVKAWIPYQNYLTNYLFYWVI